MLPDEKRYNCDLVLDLLFIIKNYASTSQVLAVLDDKAEILDTLEIMIRSNLITYIEEFDLYFLLPLGIHTILMNDEKCQKYQKIYQEHVFECRQNKMAIGTICQSWIEEHFGSSQQNKTDGKQMVK